MLIDLGYFCNFSPLTPSYLTGYAKPLAPSDVNCRHGETRYTCCRGCAQREGVEPLPTSLSFKNRLLIRFAPSLNKVKVLRCIRPLTLDDVILGQYTASNDEKEPGYLDDPTVPKGSVTPTYAAATFFIHNERWEGELWFINFL